METEPLYYNALAIGLRGSYAGLSRTLKTYGEWQRAYKEELARGAKLPLSSEKEWNYLVAKNVELFLRDESKYPNPLKEIPHSPFGIYVQGALPNLQNAIAIVGTRRASPEGKYIAEEFARALAEKGCTIVSGLAFGIDAAAHAGALRAPGKTVAVLPGGLDKIHPRTNTRLAEKILESGGALISEYPLGEQAAPYRFLERNRIVSGLCRGVLVIEAPFESGALVTARFALEQNRDVFVVPGSINHPNFKGSHMLIRQGAELVSSPQNIFDAWELNAEDSQRIFAESSNKEEMLILQALRGAPRPLDVDKIIEMTKLESRNVNQAISFLLIKNMVKETESGFTI